MPKEQELREEFENKFLGSYKGYAGEGDMEEIDYKYWKEHMSFWDWQSKEVDDVFNWFLSKRKEELEELREKILALDEEGFDEDDDLLIRMSDVLNLLDL